MTTDTSKDSLQRFLFEGTDIRGQVTTLSDSFQDLLANQQYPPQVELLLGEFLAAASLLGTTLKNSGKITIQAMGKGPIATVMTECSQGNKLRGIVRGDFDNIEGKVVWPNLSAMLPWPLPLNRKVRSATKGLCH